MNGLVSEWLVHLLQVLWQTTITAAVVLLFAHLFARNSPRLRHAVLMIGILKFAIPPMLPMPTGLFSAAPPAPEISGVRNIAFFMSGVPRLGMILLMLHAAGFMFVLLRLGLDAVRLHLLRRDARRISDGPLHDLVAGSCRRPVTLLASGHVGVPITFGFFRPVIVLPDDLLSKLTPASLLDIVAHELEHVRRWDVGLNSFQALLSAVWWFDPLFHLLSRQARIAREECCDDGAIRAQAFDTPHYARTLLEAASCLGRSAPRGAAAIAENQHSLVRRILRLSDPRFTPSRRIGAAGVLLVTALVATLLPGLRVSRRNHFAFDAATRDALGIRGHQHSHQ